MKKIFLIILLIFWLNIGLVFSEEQKKEPDDYFKDYEENIKLFCNNKDIKKSPWYSEKDILIKVKNPPYTFFENPKINSIYTEHLQKLWVNWIWNNLSLTINWPFEKAKIVYTETQNTIFNCAILKAKLNIWKAIIKYIWTKNQKSNIIKKIKDQNVILSQQLTHNCSALETDQEPKFKTILLNNVTQQYCIYKYYLNYLDVFMKNNITATLKKDESESEKYAFSSFAFPTDISTSLIKEHNSLIKEGDRAKNVYKQAIIAFEEFESTYWSHLLLSSIHDEYITVRNNFKKLLNPISQLGFKIPQAQKQK